MILSVEETEDFLPPGIFHCSNQRQPCWVGEAMGPGQNWGKPHTSPSLSCPRVVAGAARQAHHPQLISQAEGHQPQQKSSKAPRRQELLCCWSKLLHAGAGERVYSASMCVAKLKGMGLEKCSLNSSFTPPPM